jgi:molecular chaperone DnaK (HSP70)
MPTGIGIDFGTTNSVAARCDTSKRPLPLTQGGRPHPSVVWYRLDGSVVVGQDAKANINGKSGEIGNAFFSSIKRKLGTDPELDLFGEPRRPSQVAAEILKHLRWHARETYHHDVREAVVTVPVYFSGLARRELRNAANLAGIYIKTFVHEPFAAVVGHCYATGGRSRLEALEGKRFLVFDWGGGTLDVTLAEVEAGNISELETGGISDRAGDHFDGELRHHCLSRSAARNGLAVDDCNDRHARDRFLLECETRKIELSAKEETAVLLAQAYRSRADGRSFSINEKITRAEFEDLIKNDVTLALKEVDRVLEKAGISAAQVHQVLLIGGSSNLPLLQHEMVKRFGNRIVRVSNADTIIAEGASVIDAEGLQPILARTIGIGLADGAFYLFSRRARRRSQNSAGRL